MDGLRRTQNGWRYRIHLDPNHIFDRHPDGWHTRQTSYGQTAWDESSAQRTILFLHCNGCSIHHHVYRRDGQLSILQHIDWNPHLFRLLIPSLAVTRSARDSLCEALYHVQGLSLRNVHENLVCADWSGPVVGHSNCNWRHIVHCPCDPETSGFCGSIVAECIQHHLYHHRPSMALAECIYSGCVLSKSTSFECLCRRRFHAQRVWWRPTGQIECAPKTDGQPDIEICDTLFGVHWNHCCRADDILDHHLGVCRREQYLWNIWYWLLHQHDRVVFAVFICSGTIWKVLLEIEYVL